MFSRAKIIVALVLLALVLMVGIQNREPVTLRFLFWSAVVDRFLLLLGVFVLGVLAGTVLGWVGARRPRGKVQAPEA